MIITKREHACLVVEHGGSALVIDPGSFTEPFAVSDLTAIIVTHEHADHVTREHLDRLLSAARASGDPSRVKLFAPAGVATAHPDYPWHVVNDGDACTAGPFALAFSGGRHATIHRSIPIVDNVGVFVNETLYYPGD
jgi:L-ascorbate metabolism protein UlaG (beta-lactamase superfamily)